MVEDFIRDRQYLKGVSPATVAWYRDSFRAFQGALDSKVLIVQRIEELMRRGVKPVSINTYLRAVNAYLRWRHTEHEAELLRIPRLKEEQKVLATLSSEQVQRIIHFKPKGRNLSRAHLLAQLLLDTGLRFAEALNLRWEEIDLDNLLVKVVGKGGKHRVVPISFEGRKVLFKWKQQSKFDHVFATRNGTLPRQRNVGRDFALLGQRAGIQGVRFSPHTFRHTFAVSYLRAGGNVLYLQRILGHSTLEMTNRYTRSLGTEDLQAVHDRLSLLSRRA
jgi:integrase/recombinase XerD